MNHEQEIARLKAQRLRLAKMLRFSISMPKTLLVHGSDKEKMFYRQWLKFLAEDAK